MREEEENLPGIPKKALPKIRVFLQKFNIKNSRIMIFSKYLRVS